MEHSLVIEYTLYTAFFLLATALLHMVTRKIALPYTVALLLAGFFGQFVNHFFHLNIHLSLSPEVIYYVLLPVLLFEAAMHINIHQFKIQFKTITFLATFGLLVSIFAIGAGLALLAGIPFEIALLFGAIISATDPIAVLTLFKTLGAPKRLALIADGESMFNDATGVIAFKLIAGFVVANAAFQSQAVFSSLNNFLYVFLGSILFGALLGYFTAMLIKYIKTQRIIITAVISALALGSFTAAEHYFHLSGVISTVIAGLAFGNLAHGRMKNNVIRFVGEYFGYIGFLALSLVFFFASFNLDLTLFTNQIPLLFLVIVIVLVARAISVYGTVWLSNVLPFFKNEPNIPISWQHILTWGGLRGVIPLVLVYSLPDSFVYKDTMLSFTFAVLLFTLFVNGLTIKPLLLKLNLHLPKKEEKIIDDELKLFALEEARKKLQNLPQREFTPSILKEIENAIYVEETKYKRDLLRLADPEKFLLSLKLEALEVERTTLRTLYDQGRFDERILFEFESELDLQQDALEYPELYKTKGIDKRGRINSRTPYRKRLNLVRQFIARHRVLSMILHIKTNDIITERYALLRARLFTSYAAIDYMDRLKKIFAHHEDLVKRIEFVKSIQNEFVTYNKQELEELATKYPELVTAYQKKIVSQIIYTK